MCPPGKWRLLCACVSIGGSKILIVNEKNMDKKEKQCYEAPSTMVIEVRHEGIICASDVKGGNSINDWGNGGTTNDDVYM